MKKFFIIFMIISIIIIGTEIAALVYLVRTDNRKYEISEKIVTKYFELVAEGNYEGLYDYVELPSNYSKEDFIARNSKIYEGIGAANIQMEIKSVEEQEKGMVVEFVNRMDTSCGSLEFTNKATVIKNKDKKYRIKWSSNLIFPELNNDYKVRVVNIEAKRGSILDRHGAQLATLRKVSRVGVVPGKLGENKEANLTKIAELLGTTVDAINNNLSSVWVNDDTFVPIKNIPNDNELLKEQLLEIPGVKIDSELVRIYPYGEITSHITGYIQIISAEELEQVKDKGYTSDSLIGKNGLESIYEDRLRGTDGKKIYIEDDRGVNIRNLGEIPVKDGEDIKLTIDIDLQTKLYEQMQGQEGFFVVMNPRTGELLALVSVPTYDVNKFITGMTNEEWAELSNAAGNPMYTRFLGSWCPGSTMKPLTGGIGLTTGTLKTTDVFYYSGLSWRKNYTWKENKITTLTAYRGKKNLRNALIYSDNIYFAQATLKIGEQTFREGLDRLGFNQNIDVGFTTSKSQYSNTETIQGEVTLANSGYGQGEVLVNPIHMASIYSAFLNDGNMIKPYIEYRDNDQVEYLVENAFSKEAADEIREGLIQAVENAYGTGHDVQVPGITIAGKTGTAELKATRDSTGDTLGWFDCFTVDQDIDNSLLVISMAKNQSSRFVKSIIRRMFVEKWYNPTTTEQLPTEEEI